MAFDGDAFVERFNRVWNGHDIEGILAMMTDGVVFEACDILSMRDGKIAAKRSYRKGRA